MSLDFNASEIKQKPGKNQKETHLHLKLVDSVLGLMREMHQSRENIELVLQEVCVQHRNVDSIKSTLSQERRHSECVNTAKVDAPPKILQRV